MTNNLNGLNEFISRCTTKIDTEDTACKHNQNLIEHLKALRNFICIKIYSNQKTICGFCLQKCVRLFKNGTKRLFASYCLKDHCSSIILQQQVGHPHKAYRCCITSEDTNYDGGGRRSLSSAFINFDQILLIKILIDCQKGISHQGHVSFTITE